MKIFLTLSLILNLVLGYFLLTRKPEKEVVERVVIEKHAEKAPLKVEKAVEAKENKPLEKKSDSEMPLVPLEAPEEYQDAGEKMEAERAQFMMDQMGVTEEIVEQHNKIREEFFRKSSEFWHKDPTKELSFEERRKMIDLEEGYQKKLLKLYGKENWEKFQKFRDKYNREGFKKQMEEGRPFVFMNI